MSVFLSSGVRSFLHVSWPFRRYTTFFWETCRQSSHWHLCQTPWILELGQGNSWESSHTWLVAGAQEFTLLHLAASDRPTAAPEATEEEIIFLQPRTNPLVEEDSSRFCPIKRWGFPAKGRLCSDKTPTLAGICTAVEIWMQTCREGFF